MLTFTHINSRLFGELEYISLMRCSDKNELYSFYFTSYETPLLIQRLK